MAQEARELLHPQAGPILIVDDEDSITRSLQGALSDEGLESVIAHDGRTALELVEALKPALVLLDIWMPGLDGLATLREIKARWPSIPVVMISGHATIATAMKASQIGASGFIEKPLDLSATLATIQALLASSPKVPGESGKSSAQTAEIRAFSIGGSLQKQLACAAAFDAKLAPGRLVQQKTLSHSAILYGQGLHSGKKSGLILEPLPANSGIHFMGISEGTAVPGYLDFVESTGFATTLHKEGVRFKTIEHLMSALHAYRISNLLVKCNAEVPVMDGSAREFCALFDEVGIVEQEGEWRELAVMEVVRVGSEKEYIQLEPAAEFSVEYFLEYPAPVGIQKFCFVLDKVESYRHEIAPARTFGFVRDIGALQKQGLALGGRFDNFVLIGDEGAINVDLRFPDELVRHKILDVIGDLYLLGRPLRAKVTARMTGHSDNVAVLRKLREQLEAI